MKRMKLSTAYLIVGTVIIVLVRRSHAETLLPAAAQTDWSTLGLAVLFGAAVVGVIWWLRHNPGAAAKAEAKAATLEAGLASVAHNAVEMAAKATSALHSLAQTHAEAVAKIPAPAATDVAPAGAAEAPATPAAPAGKNGQAGAFAIQVSGVPAADMPAINVQYFG